jgi:hypothetical protein
MSCVASLMLLALSARIIPQSLVEPRQDQSGRDQGRLLKISEVQ